MVLPFLACHLWASSDEIMYFNRTFGLLHQNPYGFSSGVTTIACGTPVTFIAEQSKSNQDFKAVAWPYVKFADQKGYIDKNFLSSQMPYCWQQQYPVFFMNLNLDLTDLYLWGRLQDQVISFTSDGGLAP